MKKKIFGEVFGSALLVFFGPALVVMGGYNDLLGPSLGWGISLAVLVYAFGPLSGAHFNPAVTVMMFLTKQMLMPLWLLRFFTLTHCRLMF